MKIWWFYRFSMESFIFIGVTFWFCGAGGYYMNYRKRYVKHKQKRVRSNYRNPYFIAPADRKLSYDQFFNVKKEKALLSNELNAVKI